MRQIFDGLLEEEEFQGVASLQFEVRGERKRRQVTDRRVCPQQPI